MGYVPRDAEWFIATLVVSITVGSRKRVTVHENDVLVHAKNAKSALKRALTLGKYAESDYRNSAGERVRFKFLGLRELNVIHDKLEHGAELSFTETLGVTPKRALARTTPRQRLAVFRPRTPSAAPDYASAEVMQRLAEAMGRRPGTRKRTAR